MTRDKLYKALKDLLRYAETNTCAHEETHRGGTNWTICDGCGEMWADDKGGFKPYKEPPVFTAARDALEEEEVKVTQPLTVAEVRKLRRLLEKEE